MKKGFLFFLAILLLFNFSCLEEETYPIEPRITFLNYTKIVNISDTTLQLSLSFTDGDGDIGLYESETTPPYDFNFFIDLLKLTNGQLIKVVFPDTTLSFNSRIPIITPNTRNKAIKGVLNYSFDYQLLQAFFMADTIGFDVYIRDRALHQSNVVRTPLFIIE